MLMLRLMLIFMFEMKMLFILSLLGPSCDCDGPGDLNCYSLAFGTKF